MSSDDELGDIQSGKQEDKKKDRHDTFTIAFVVLNIKNLVLKSSGTVATGVPMPMDWVNRKDFIMANGDKPASQRTSEKGNAAIDKDWTIPIPAA
ncbi:hypothetical protein ACHAO9_011574 [Fusarium lateritium]